MSPLLRPLLMGSLLVFTGACSMLGGGKERLA